MSVLLVFFCMNDTFHVNNSKSCSEQVCVCVFGVPVLHFSSGCRQSGLCLKSRLWTARGHDLAMLAHLEICPVCLIQAL